MTHGKVKQWLDALLEKKKEFNDLQEIFHEKEDVFGCEELEIAIHIYKGIEKIADALGVELNESPFDYGGEITTEYYFMYRDAKVFQIDKSENK